MDRASSQLYQAKDAPRLIAAGNRGQHERLFHALGRSDLAAQSSHEERERLYESRTAELQRIIAQRTADESEQYLQSRHVPAGRVRTLSEGLMTVPIAAFKFAHGGPNIETPPPRLGQHTEEVLRDLGYTGEQIAVLRAEGAI